MSREWIDERIDAGWTNERIAAALPLALAVAKSSVALRALERELARDPEWEARRAALRAEDARRARLGLESVDEERRRRIG